MSHSAFQYRPFAIIIALFIFIVSLLSALDRKLERVLNAAASVPRAASKGPDFGLNVHISDALPAGTTFVSHNAGGGACTAPAPGSPRTLNCTLPQLNKGATWNVNVTVKVNVAGGATLFNTAATISNMQDFVPANNVGTITTPVNAPTI